MLNGFLLKTRSRHEVRSPKFACFRLLSSGYLPQQFYKPYNDNNNLLTKMVVEPLNLITFFVTIQY